MMMVIPTTTLAEEPPSMIASAVFIGMDVQVRGLVALRRRRGMKEQAGNWRCKEWQQLRVGY